MNSIKVELKNQIKGGLKNFKCLFGLILLLISGCATVGVNNYQNAETLGNGKLKLGAAFEYGRQMDAGIHTFGGEIEVHNDLDWEDFTFPLIELSGQYGITASTDIGLDLTTTAFPWSGSAAIHLKQNLVHTPGNFAVALMPKGGIFGSDTESSGTALFRPEIRWEEKDEFNGFFFDIPLIISKRWSFFSIHLSPKYMYHHLNVKTDYKEFRKSDDTMVEHSWDEASFDFNTFGASVGFSLMFKHFHLTPEVSFLHVKDLPNDSYRWIYYPGLGLYIKF